MRRGPLIWRAARARPRLIAGVFCGIVAWFTFSGLRHEVTRSVVAWDIGVIVYLVLSALLFLTERESKMPEDAARQQEGEWTIFGLTIGAALASFVAIFGVFANSKDLPADQKSLHVALVTLTLAVSWFMTHTTFAFRYAHEFYSHDAGGPDVDGGLEFPGEKQPDYLDFLYFALVLGMTFQVSDVQITSRKLRRLAMVHGVLSFLFNTIILALTVNIAASLI